MANGNGIVTQDPTKKLPQLGDPGYSFFLPPTDQSPADANPSAQPTAAPPAQIPQASDVDALNDTSQNRQRSIQQMEATATPTVAIPPAEDDHAGGFVNKLNSFRKGLGSALQGVGAAGLGFGAGFKAPEALYQWQQQAPYRAAALAHEQAATEAERAQIPLRQAETARTAAQTQQMKDYVQIGTDRNGNPIWALKSKAAPTQVRSDIAAANNQVKTQIAGMTDTRDRLHYAMQETLQRAQEAGRNGRADVVAQEKQRYDNLEAQYHAALVGNGATHNQIEQYAAQSHDENAKASLDEKQRADAAQVAEHQTWGNIFQGLTGLGGPSVPQVAQQQGPAPPRPQVGGGSQQPSEGQTATGPGGHKILFTRGQWVDFATRQPIGR
jgi:hypothetical protein